VYKVPTRRIEGVIAALHGALDQINEGKHTNATTPVERDIRYIGSTDLFSYFQLRLVWKQGDGVWLYKQMLVRSSRMYLLMQWTLLSH
jgi:hypothetical protein